MKGAGRFDGLNWIAYNATSISDIDSRVAGAARLRQVAVAAAAALLRKALLVLESLDT